MNKITVLEEEVIVPTKKNLELRLKELQGKYGNKLFTKIGNIRLLFLHEQEPEFTRDLAIYNKYHNGIFYSGEALHDLGFGSKYFLTLDEASDIALSVVTLDNLKKAGNPNRLHSLVSKQDPLIRRAFKSLQNAGKHLIWDLLEEKRPEVFNILQRKKFSHDFKDSQLIEHYSQRFFQERPILLRSEKTSRSLSIDRYVQRITLDEKLKLQTSSGSDAVDKSIQKVVHYLSANPTLSNIQSEDISRTPREKNKLLGTLAETEGELIFLSYKKNPNLFKGTSLDFLVGKNISRVISTRDRKKISLESNGFDQREADFRLVIENGKEEHILVDVKSYSHVRKDALKRMIDYKNYDRWADGKPIAKKIIIFNSLTYNIVEVKKELEKNGLHVVTGSEFNELYGRFLANLSPQFTYEVEIPLAGTSQEILSKMYRSHQLISAKSSFLAQKNNSYLLKYLFDFNSSLRNYFSGNIPLVIEEERKEFVQLPREIIRPLKDVYEEYNRAVDMDHLEGIMKNNLYLDLETSGLGRSYPIYLTGLSYVHEDMGPVVHILISRDPLEEKQMLKSYEKIALHLQNRSSNSAKYQHSIDLSHDKKISEKDGLIIDFNGRSFDQKVLYKRFMANRLPYTIQGEHLDLRPPWRAWGKELPNQKLQTYERIILNSRIRHGDIEGKEIPRIYFDGIRGSSIERMKKIIDHNLPDLATLVLLHADLQDEGLLDRKISPELFDSLNYSSSESSIVPF